MFQLFVFHVDTGSMIVFDMELALERVSHLLEAISSKSKIPVNKQVLLVANGEPLNPSNRVSQYVGAGTETNPIFLFSKLAIESPVPPSVSLNLGSESALKEEVEKSVKMPPTYETLVNRSSLAGEFNRHAKDLSSKCERSVLDQQLQQQGWRAAGANLDNITRAFQSHADLFEQQYTEFLSTKEHYQLMLERYEDVIGLLKKVPVLPCLQKDTDSKNPKKALVLLDWINSQEQRISLDALARQCSELLQQFGENALDSMMVEVTKILDSVNNPGMKEIKGLDERIARLQQRLQLARQLAQDQSEMSQGFYQNLKRAEHLGDTSVLPDLCASHQKQLVLMMKNHHQLCEIQNLCARAKEELSANLHARLRWVMIMEHSICECDTRLLVYHENLKRIRRRLEIFEQVFETPRIYVLAVLEVLRRKSFSIQFLDWGRSVSSSAVEARLEEISKREKFLHIFGNHFLQSMFKGMEDRPPKFADEAPPKFDDRLPNVTVDDVKLLQNAVPELLTELSLVESLEKSVVVREQLSQSNLSRLVDPKQNPTLGETLEFRRRTKVDPASVLTVSQVQREMSEEDVDFSQKDSGLLKWQLGDDALQIDEGHFKPGSLKSLSSGSPEIYHDPSVGVDVLACELPKAKSGGDEFDGRTDTPKSMPKDSASLSPNEYAITRTYAGSSRPISKEDLKDTCCSAKSHLYEIISKLKLATSSVEFETCKGCDQCRESYNRLTATGSHMDQLLHYIDSLHFKGDTLVIDSSNALMDKCISIETTSGKSTTESDTKKQDNTLQLREELSSLTVEKQRILDENTELRRRLDSLTSQEVEMKSLLDVKESQIKTLNDHNNLLNDEIGKAVSRAVLKTTEERKNLVEDLENKLIQQGKSLEDGKQKITELQSEQIERERLFFDLSKKSSALESELQRRERDYFKNIKEYREKLELQKQSFQQELDKQKADLLLSFELEKDCASDKKGGEQGINREASVEEGVDALEWERVQTKLKKVEEENKQLRKLQEASAGSLKDQLLEAKTMVNEKDAQCESLHNTLAELQNRLQQFSLSGLKEKLAVRDLDVGHTVLLFYDDNCKTYVAVTLGDIKYFLHSDSLKGLETKINEAVQRGEWILGSVTDKEYCVAKKSQNRFKLPVGTYFYRIHAKIWTV